MESVSILIGAGFSVPKGYPSGKELNEFIKNCGSEGFRFTTAGQLVKSENSHILQRCSYDTEFEFGVALIKYYDNDVASFDYEEFYDFLLGPATSDPKVDLVAAPFKSEGISLQDLIFSFKTIYQQIVGYYLVDREGNRFYDNQPSHIGPTYFGYSGILQCLQRLRETSEVNIHTLNHDLFLESLNRTTFFNGDLDDGFEELGSHYYGVLDCEGAPYTCRLERYTGNYRTNMKLYKLHGSRNYAVFHESTGMIMKPECYVKTKWRIDLMNLLKEKTNAQGELYYDRCWINYHPDFLTGTTSKITRYKEPLLYLILFDHFEANLKKANKLLIIGYGAKDSEINKMLQSNFNGKSAYIIDPYPSPALQSLAKSLNASIITKQLEDVSLTDLGL